MKISNEHIIQLAKRQRQEVHNKMGNGQRPMVSGQWWMVAASLVGFFAGYALHAAMQQPQPAEKPVAEVVVQRDTIMQVQTVRDTVWQTRIVTKYEKQPMLAEQDNTPAEQQACSMLCDDIPYELLATVK